MMNLNDLYFFVQVVEHGGFAAAARALRVPKSTLSKRVAQLEEQLGARLIQRTSRRFMVTETGEAFFRHAAAVLIEAEAAENVVRGRLAEPTGTVRLTASVPTAQFSLAKLLPELARAFPKITLVVHATDRFVDVVQEGIDIAVRDHFAPLPDSGLVQRRVAFDPTILVAGPDYAERRGMPRTPVELAEHDGLLATPAATPWRLRDSSDSLVEVRPTPRFVADESLVLLEAAMQGLGITSLPRKLCRAAIDAGRLVRVLPEWTAGGVTTSLLTPERRGQLPSVRAVLEFLAERLGAEADGDSAA